VCAAVRFCIARHRHRAAGRRSAAAIDGVTCSANSWSYYRHFNRPPVYSPPITCTPIGGVPPYAYSWQKISGDANIQATNQASNSTSFTRGVANGGYWVATFHLVVTDATGSVAVSPTVTVEFEWETGQ
jgi:hypothetical protein